MLKDVSRRTALLGVSGAGLSMAQASPTQPAVQDALTAPGQIIGLFVRAGAITIPPDVLLVESVGHTVQGKGAARYVFDPIVDGAYVRRRPQASFLDGKGRGFRLAEDLPTTAMYGALATGEVDDAPAVQAALNDLTFRKGGRLNFTPGTYLFRSQVQFDGSGLEAAVNIVGYGAHIRTVGRISGFRVIRNSNPIPITVSGLLVDHRGSGQAYAGFEQVNTANLNWQDCCVYASAPLVPNYACWLLKPSDPNNEDTSCFWTRFPGCTIRSTGGNVIPNGIVLAGAHNATDFGGISISGVKTAIVLGYAEGTLIPLIRRGTANCVRCNQMWIEGADIVVEFRGEPGGYGPYGLEIIGNRLESIGTILAIRGVKINHNLPPIIGPNATQAVKQIVDNPEGLYVNIHGPLGEYHIFNQKGWTYQGTDAAYDVQTLVPANLNSGWRLNLPNSTSTAASIRQVAGSVVEFSANLGVVLGLRLKGVRAISATGVGGQNLRGAVTLGSGGGQVAFASVEPDNQYEIWLQGSVTGETFCATNKTPGGFSIRSSNRASNAKVGWLLIR